MFSFLRRLQWKLTFSYVLVTMATVIAIASLLIGIAILIESQNTSRIRDSFFWSKTAFQDNIPGLLDEPEHLQAWLERINADGFNFPDFQSYTVRESIDYANTLIPGAPMYVLDPHLNLIASVPAAAPENLGKPFSVSEIRGYSIESILQAALVGNKDYFAQSMRLAEGIYVVAFPLRLNDESPVSAIVIYQLRPVPFITPTNLEIYRTFLYVTVGIMLVTAVPVGAIFGWLASRGLRKRLAALSVASKAWSAGDFSPAPGDRSGDEIGELTRNLVSMADQLQILIQTRNELIRVEERNRLARDLHDTVKQQTYAARMQLSAAKNLLPTDANAAADHLEAALQLNRETQQELKLIIEELRPASLEGKGLAQAIVEYTTRWQEHTGITVTTAISGERSLPMDIEHVLYRVLQESLSNVARHSEADSVAVTLEISLESLTLSIVDNGRGFELAAVTPYAFGLKGMKDRLGEINGTLVVDSALSVGTKVIARVELKPER